MVRWQNCGVPVAALALTLSCAGGLGVVGAAAAAPRAGVVVAPGCYGGSGLDLNEDGHTDVPAGEPAGDVGSVRDAGVVEVRYGCGAHAVQRLALPHPHRGDRFGAALAGGRYDDRGKGVTALFVGVPDLDVKGHKNAGGVAEFHATSAGLTFAKLWTQDTKGVPGKVQGGAHFGAALSLSDWNEERFHLRIGEPGLDVGKDHDTGGYVVLSWNEDPDDPPSRSAEVTLRVLGLHPQDGDLFGSSFAQGTSFRVGAPGRRVHGQAGAGAVLDRWEGTRLIDQSTPGIAGSPEKGDHFGATLSGNWIGVPDEALGDVAGAGTVEYWDPANPASAAAVDQGTTGVPGDVGAGHHFGAALDAGNDAFDQHVFVGAPGDRGGAGSVTLLREAKQPGTISSAVALPTTDRPGAHAGASLAQSGLYHELVGAPDADGGRVSSYGLSPTGPSDPTLELSWTPVDGGTRGQLGASLSGPELDADS